MRRMIWLTTIFVLFMVFVLPGVLAFWVKYIPSDIQPSLDKTRNIYDGLVTSQEFTSQKPGLTGIAMTIKNPNLKNKKDVFLSLYGEDKALVRKTKLNGANIEDGSYVKFLFEPVTDSGDKIYKFIITNPDAGAEDILELFYTDDKPDWIGQMMFDNEEVSGGISFVTLHKPQSKWAVINEIYSNWLSKLLFGRSQKI